MKIGFLSDAHGNPFGLQGCIRALRARGAEQIFFLGDAVGYFPLVEEVLSVLISEKIPCQMGNHDAMFCGRLPLDSIKDRTYNLGELARRISPELKRHIAEWPLSRRIKVSDFEILLVHGSPRDELSEYIYPDSDLSQFVAINVNAVLLGHTHIPFVKKAGDVLVINVGSCGLPRDIGNQAACALLDTDSRTGEILRAPFDAGKLLSESRLRGTVAKAVERCLDRRKLSRFKGEPHQ